MENFLIGTSGYDYAEWKGVFYPEKLARKDFLSYYATQFNALELNSTFYSMPDAGRMQSFYERTEGKVCFSVKANKTLTHDITRNWKIDAETFRNAMDFLQEKDRLSAVLFQFPESFRYENENRLYLAALTEFFAGFPVFVEFRHKEWIRNSVFEGIRQRNAGIVFCDMPQLKNLPDGFGMKTPFIGKNAYIRLHGRNKDAWYAHDVQNNGSARYCYDYKDEELESFVPVIGTALKEGKRTQVYFNNHPNASGAKNACRLKDLICSQ